MLRHWELKPPSHPNAPLAERLLVYSTSRIVANPTTESSVMKHLSDLGLEDSVGRHRRLAVKSALIFARVSFTYTFALPISSHSQAPSISTPSGLTRSEKSGLEIPLGLPAAVRESLIPKDNPMTAEKVSR